jgi:hypothetical protein
MLDWVEVHSGIEGALAFSRGQGRIIEAYGELHGVQLEERVVQIAKQIFASSNPYLLESSHFCFNFFGKKFRVVSVVDARISAVSSSRQFQVTFERFSWGFVVFLFKAPQQFGDGYKTFSKWAQNIHQMEAGP